MTRLEDIESTIGHKPLELRGQGSASKGEETEGRPAPSGQGEEPREGVRGVQRGEEVGEGARDRESPILGAPAQQ